MENGSKKAGAMLLASAVAGLLVLNGAIKAQAAEDSHTTEGKVKCYGANACKGQGTCAQAGHGCGGKNACKGQGVIETDSKEACLKMEGGRLTESK